MMTSQTEIKGQVEIVEIDAQGFWPGRLIRAIQVMLKRFAVLIA